jgi:hypothetical protein
MQFRLLVVAAIMTCAGCIRISRVGTPHPPTWIGGPASILAPNSLEGETWREQHIPLKGRPYIENPPPGLTIQPPTEPLLRHRPLAWDPSHPFTQGP